MAYTYEDFTTAAQNAGLLDGFSEDDLNIAKTNPEYGLSMLKLRQDAAGATTTEQQLLAQEAENQLRSAYGSLGAQTQSSFQYGNENEYQKLLNDVTNYQPFSYDAGSDPSYSAYKKAYLREAERATQDTLAKASAASGGVPSSYAVSAAQQAGNYYTGQLNDAIPTLQQNAYQRYLSDYNAKLSAFDAMSTDRNFDYNAYLQEYERKQQKWNNALTLYQMGQRTPEILAILGIPEETMAGGGDSGSSSGGSGGSGGSRGSGGGTGTYGSNVDLQSVLNLGYGPISPTTLGNLVNSGAVSMSTNGNKITVSNNKTNNGTFGTLYSITQKKQRNGGTL